MNKVGFLKKKKKNLNFVGVYLIFDTFLSMSMQLTHKNKSNATIHPKRMYDEHPTYSRVGYRPFETISKIYFIPK